MESTSCLHGKRRADANSVPPWRHSFNLAFPCPFIRDALVPTSNKKRSDARRAAPPSEFLKRSACPRVCIGSLLSSIVAAQPQQVDRATVAFDQAHAGMPATRNEAQDRNARHIIAGIFIVEIERKMLPEV